MNNSSIKKYQRGLTSVEFSLCGAVYFIVLFAVIEVARFLFAINVLDEVTRRGARLASVCPITQQASIINTAIFGGDIVTGLGPEHVQINYLRSDYTLIPAANLVASFSQITFVQVSINQYTHQLLIPLLNDTFTLSPFSTTVLAESLGVSPPGTGTTSC